MGKAKKDAHPRKDFGAITQVGLKAQKLAQDQGGKAEGGKRESGKRESGKAKG